ncbi:MAG: discoidin domain-containing protein [Prevotella sp.]|nr:discoidin domain-containing protein [Prevotella sp.]
MTKTKLFIASLLWCFTLVAHADNKPLEGFHYGNDKAPTGEEWQSPMLLGYNKLQPRAWFASFANVEEARHVLPEYSSHRMSLNGTWKFHFAKNPDERPKDFYLPTFDCSVWDDVIVPSNWNIIGIQQDGSQKYGTPIYVNQPVIFYHQVKKDDWREGVMRTPPTNWTTYKYRNEVGSYRRTFTIPKTWKGEELFVEFDGVDSFFYLWVNGQYVGFSKNSRDAARFDITRFAHIGDNSISVEVYRNSDGSFLEAQDMFRLPGIFRSVNVYATPKVHIQDLVVHAQADGNMKIETTLENLSTKTVKGYKVEYELYANKLYADNNDLVDCQIMTGKDTGSDRGMAPNTTCTRTASITVNNVKTWTSEEPNLYVLVAKLKDKKGRVKEVVSTQVGFRTVEIKDVPASEDEFGLAGRYFLINGKPLKLKGVNRHETNPATGHAITREQMREEVMMMKRANINHVRTSHYSYDPYFYYLCNKYGIWLEAEANLESHEYYYGEASLSHPIEWRPAHIARMMELAHSRVNDPCIAIWSLGNEAGPGDNFKASYAALKAFDTSRPVQYERNNDIVDMGSNQYPSVNWVRSAVKGNMNIKYPFHISEYAHSMGNAVGNLIDYWEAIESTNFFCGGAIWDWIDQSLYNYGGRRNYDGGSNAAKPQDERTKEGSTSSLATSSSPLATTSTVNHLNSTIKYLAYGGDFGDTPNDREFVMNGIIFGDMEPKPQYYEVKKVYQNIGIKWNDVKTGTIDIFNKNYYTDDLSSYDCFYTLEADGEKVKEGKIDVGSIAPRKHKTVNIDGLNPQALDHREYFLTIEFMQKHDTPWAKSGFVQADEQLLVKQAEQRPALSMKGALILSEPTNDLLKLSDGNQFHVSFDLKKGTIYSLQYGNEEMIDGHDGLLLDAFRAPVNNDNWGQTSWYQHGLDRLQQKVLSWNKHVNEDGSMSLAFTTQSQADGNDFCFQNNIIYTVYADGTIEVQSAITSNNPTVVLPRLGYSIRLPKSLNNLTYYGRGPIDNYPDRKSGQFIRIYNNKVEKEFENFPKPQDMGNHQDTRYCQLTNNQGKGLLLMPKDKMSFSILPWNAQELAQAKHPHELPISNHNTLHLDIAITGLGGNSCGQGAPLEHDRVKATPHTFAFIIRPAANKPSMVQPAGPAPLIIERDAEGNVAISSTKENHQPIYYLVNDGTNAKNKKRSSKPQRYTGTFNLRNGGTVKAYEQGCEWIVNSKEFERIDHIPVTVSFASSVESGEGNAEHLVDGNPNTYWHTMWSVTVANYPHWVDFDCGTTKMLKGFAYLPRQDSSNGNIKEYSIQVSNDGKTWGESICQGTFANDKKEKKILFSQPVKARYLRFNALSSQDGQDFATGAEFSILEQ